MTLISIPARERAQPAVPAEPPIAQSTLIIISPPPPLPPMESVAPSSASSTSAPAIDWRREAQRSAGNAIRMQSTPAPRSFEVRAAPQPAAKQQPFDWNPSPGKIGFSGGLPYVEIGRHCIVGLGFFGCAIGEPPAPNGKLFDGIDNPDRDRSSVPDASR